MHPDGITGDGRAQTWLRSHPRPSLCSMTWTSKTPLRWAEAFIGVQANASTGLAWGCSGGFTSGSTAVFSNAASKRDAASRETVAAHCVHGKPVLRQHRRCPWLKRLQPRRVQRPDHRRLELDQAYLIYGGSILGPGVAKAAGHTIRATPTPNSAAQSPPAISAVTAFPSLSWARQIRRERHRRRHGVRVRFRWTGISPTSTPPWMPSAPWKASSSTKARARQHGSHSGISTGRL